MPKDGAHAAALRGTGRTGAWQFLGRIVGEGAGCHPLCAGRSDSAGTWDLRWEKVKKNVADDIDIEIYFQYNKVRTERERSGAPEAAGLKMG